jgi:hypothetical protein
VMSVKFLRFMACILPRPHPEERCLAAHLEGCGGFSQFALVLRDDLDGPPQDEGNS